MHEYPDITVHLTLFNCTILKGQPQLLEHNDMKWITSAEIPNYQFCPADEEIIKIILQIGVMTEIVKITKKTLMNGLTSFRKNKLRYCLIY